MIRVRVRVRVKVRACTWRRADEPEPRTNITTAITKNHDHERKNVINVTTP